MEIRFTFFVDEKNNKKPMQYNTVQNKLMDLIQKKDLRDDHGELFGFGTHMFRHVYGIRLTELCIWMTGPSQNYWAIHP